MAGRAQAMQPAFFVNRQVAEFLDRFLCILPVAFIPIMWYYNYIEREVNNMENYFAMRNKFVKGEITITEWNLYCMKVLNEIMTKNKKNFKKSKKCLTVKIKYGIIIIEREVK